jgi:hypothetical protein
MAGWMALRGPCRLVGLNLLYFTKAQPLINRAFNQSHANRFQNRTAFLEEIAFLKNLEELSAALTRALSNGLGLSHADLYISPSVAQRILEAVRAYRPEGDLAGRMEGITVSIARASCPADNDQADNLIKTAERLLYKAKASGKNHIAAVEHQRCLQAV